MKVPKNFYVNFSIIHGEIFLQNAEPEEGSSNGNGNQETEGSEVADFDQDQEVNIST